MPTDSATGYEMAAAVSAVLPAADGELLLASKTKFARYPDLVPVVGHVSVRSDSGGCTVDPAGYHPELAFRAVGDKSGCGAGEPQLLLSYSV